MAGRMATLAYDKAADDEKVHECLHGYGIKPLIHNRALWKGELERPLPGGRYPLHLVHEESGTVSCYDTVSDPPVKQKMACIGYEKGREKIKYRCPAKHHDLPCPSMEKCNAGKGYGLVVRIRCELDSGEDTLRRREPPGPSGCSMRKQGAPGALV